MEDALNATRAAVEEGIVPGGGVVFLRVMNSLDGVKMSDDEMVGINIVRRSLEEPIRQIADNAGVEGSIVVDKVKKENGAFGYNAEAGQYEDLLKAGITDPTKVARIALENAASISGLLLTTQAIISDKPEEEKAPAGMPPGGMPGGMGGMY